jgi:hypothetical protein
MEVEYQRLVDEMERMEKVLGNVQKRDSYTYRSLFGLDPIDNNVWRGGIGGHNEYENFEQYKKVGGTIIETQKRLRRLKHSLVIQSKSLDTIMNYAKKEEKFLASRPSIKPVRSDKLAKGVNFLSGFGYRIHPIFKVKKMHYGIDFTAPKGTAIQATGSGRVVKATRNAGFGNHIVIDHGFGYQTIYAHLSKINIKSKYIHSDIDALERVEILRELRLGVIDVLVGVNLLREGLDLPEVSLVVVLDADKEGFLRNEKSLTQTSGRAARNVRGRVIFYGDKITMSMQRTIDETNRRRAKQIQYNTAHNITPTTIVKSIEQVMKQTAVLDIKGFTQDNINIRTTDELNMVAEPNSQYETIPQMEKAILQTKKQMEKMAKAMDFMEAAKLRDEMFRMELQLEKMKTS